MAADRWWLLAPLTRVLAACIVVYGLQWSPAPPPLRAAAPPASTAAAPASPLDVYVSQQQQQQQQQQRHQQLQQMQPEQQQQQPAATAVRVLVRDWLYARHAAPGVVPDEWIARCPLPCKVTTCTAAAEPEAARTADVVVEPFGSGAFKSLAIGARNDRGARVRRALYNHESGIHRSASAPAHDFLISFDPVATTRHIPFTWSLHWRDLQQQARAALQRSPFAQRSRAVVFVSRRSEPFRNDMVQALGKHYTPGYAAYGSVLHNTAWPAGHEHDKQHALEQHMFCIGIENTAEAGYNTEKLFDCLRSGAIPIYWGVPAQLPEHNVTLGDALVRWPGDARHDNATVRLSRAADVAATLTRIVDDDALRQRYQAWVYAALDDAAHHSPTTAAAELLSYGASASLFCRICLHVAMDLAGYWMNPGADEVAKDPATLTYAQDFRYA